MADTLPESVRDQLDRLTEPERRRLVRIVADCLDHAEAVHRLRAVNPDPTRLETWASEVASAVRRLCSSLNRLDNLVDVPPALRAIVAEPPSAAAAGYRDPGAVDAWNAAAADRIKCARRDLRLLRDAAARSKQRKRRRSPPREPVPLTRAQTEACKLFADYEGNMTAAAKAAGKSRQRITALYNTAMKKLGIGATKKKPQTKPLPTDSRKQVDVDADGTPTRHRRRVKPPTDGD
jgi:hypothetical protein